MPIKDFFGFYRTIVINYSKMEVEMTKEQNSSDLQHVSQYLSTIEDFRIEKRCAHKLSDILFIGLLTFLSSGEDY